MRWILIEYINILVFLIENRLYFVDAGVDKIEVVDLNGGNRRTILSETGSHFFAISIHKQYLYYTDWTKQ